MDRTRAMYPELEFETYFPAAESLEAFVNSQGMSSIFKSVEARKTAAASARLIRCTARLKALRCG